VSFDRVLVEVVAAGFVVGVIAYAMVSEASLPNGKPGCEAVGKAAFDKLHRSFECDALWSDEEVNVVWHHDIGMQKIAGAVVIEGFEEKRGVAFNLEESAAVMGSCCDEVRAGSGGAARDRHSVIVNRVSEMLKECLAKRKAYLSG